MTYNGYKEVEHTTDIALQIWAEDFPSLLKQAAKGFYSLVGIQFLEEKSLHQLFVIPNGNYESVLVDFLTELLYFVEEKSLYLSNFTFEDDQDQISVRSTAWKIKSRDREIKAVTYHNLYMRKTEKGFSTTVTFDV